MSNRSFQDINDKNYSRKMTANIINGQIMGASLSFKEQGKGGIAAIMGAIVGTAIGVFVTRYERWLLFKYK